jgi:hypothetical protein
MIRTASSTFAEISRPVTVNNPLNRFGLRIESRD